MTNVATQTCGSCGAEIFGTKFCESCGAPAVTSPTVVPPAPTPVTAYQRAPYAPARTGSAMGARIATLALLIVTLVFPGVVEAISANVAINVGSFVLISVTVLTIAVAAASLIASLGGNIGTGAKVAGVVLSVAYLGIWLLQNFLPIYGGGLDYYLIDTVAYLALFLAWALTRPFRGFGYLSIVLLIVVELVRSPIRMGVYQLGNYQVAAVLLALIDVLFAISIVGLAALLERRSAVAAEGAPFVPAGTPLAQALVGPPQLYGNGATTNSLATASFVVAISSFVINLFARLVPGGGAAVFGFIALGGLITAIVLGHVARRQIRMTGQRGAGFALAGMLIGYIVIALSVIVVIIAFATVASVLGQLGGY